VQPVDQESSDDDLYDWFIDAMAQEFGAAEEVRPGVVHVWSVVDGETDRRPYELRVTRDELRAVAHATINIFDDTQGDVSVPATNPVHAGLDAFTFHTQESMDSGSQLSRTYEFDNGQMRRLNLH
jgi:hypothetical protein